MVKASPVVRAFNAGEFSALMEGRTDMEFYPASLRHAMNFIVTPQGPIIARSGTKFSVPARSDDQTSRLLPFIFSNEQAKILEFCEDRIRFIDENGIQVYAPVAATVLTTTPFKLNVPLLVAAEGDQVVFDGFPAQYNLNGEIANIVAVSGTQYTFDRNVPASVVSAGTVSLVYAIELDYTEEERAGLSIVQDIDIVYILSGSKITRKLSRFADYDWRISDVQLIDGPYLPTNETDTSITISATGNALPTMTTNTLPSGTAAGSSKRAAVAAAGTFLGRTYALGLAATDYFQAFDDDDETYWASNTAQTGTLQITPAAGFVCNGYTIYAALDNNDLTYLNTDFSPSTWYFEGYDGANWHILDFQEDYVNYFGNKSQFFELTNTVSYSAYRIRVLKLVKNGPIEVRIRRLVLRSATSASLTLTASSIIGINRDQGFKETDVGRLIRLKGGDNFWRWLRINTYTSSLAVTATLMSNPFLKVSSIQQWRLGVWSDTTGWPAVGDFFGQRLFLGPSNDFPNVICGSVVGLYENFTHVEEDGSVLDDGGIVHYIKSPQLSRMKWLTANERGLIVGTGSTEFVIEKSVQSDANLTQRNIQSNPSTTRGSANASAIKIDNRVLHVPRNGRSVREFTYSFESNGYVSNNLSRFASHLGVVGFSEQAFAGEPHTIDWIRRSDNTLVGLTYNRDEGVVAWHRHDLAGAEVESLVVIPQQDQQQDTLWMQTRRTIDGTPRRYIEYMSRAWDFDMTLEDAVFVDCAITYDGPEVDTVYGAQHLEGQEVYGLARNGDGTEETPYQYLPFGPITVVDGSVPLPFPAGHLVIGLGFESEGEISRVEAGSNQGTALGIQKRINAITALVWDTVAAQFGTYDDEREEWTYDDATQPGDLSESEIVELYTGLLGPLPLSQFHNERGTLRFRRPMDKPLPFNLVALMPRMAGYDAP